MKRKIVDSGNIIDLVESHRLEGRSIALCHGVFDLLHAGHFAHFRAASKVADILIVSVTADEFVNKGPGRPLFDLSTRMSYLSDLEMIDYVIPSHFPTAVENINLIKPNVYLKDKEYAPGNFDITGNISLEVEAVERHGGEVKFTSERTASSTNLINRQLAVFDSATSKWLEDLRNKFSLEEVYKYLELIQNLNIGLVGEIIFDRYSQCTPLAKSSKDPILAFQLHSTETFRGGVLAIADSLSQWVSRVNVYSFAGKSNDSDYLDYDNHNKKIHYNLIKCENRPNIVKHRYVEDSSKIRLFESYQFDPSEFSEIESRHYWDYQAMNIEKEDLVIVADYGHGFINSVAREVIINRSNFLSVNAQANAGNRGYNTITKYPGMDLMCLNGAEFQLEIRNSKPDYKELIPSYMDRLDCQYAIVTLGGDGMLVFDRKGNFAKIPALGTKVVDKVGAGDSVLAMASVLGRIGAPVELMGMLASLVAAHEVSQLGHRSSMSMIDIKKSVKGLLS
jgi:cytidyltransferase-like protein